MLKDVTLGQYFPYDSPLHRLDARGKLIFVALYFVAVFLAANPAGCAFIAVCAFAVMR
jgi:energy-coupling factor transport system permease protein